ncbi:BrnT family toxin [Oscillatoria salina]|uniref:BrnT family toxin n=1 Tax=Oscillatoria salina TaxID=331517 RepID=UPI0013B5ECC4|nr:BrnT family toxin [Oscillatoria salina]MBZ8182407.1 BrnT family toxin [Oscillatoria salina IIICB1]NET88505.1 BrnT family toxin [Kamptonema sp. SIO1D9]
MDVYFVLNGITFVWNEEKARKNPLKHDGVTFEQAAESFFDPFLKVIDASRNEEARDAIIGLDTNWNLLFIVHLAFENNLIRIISARQATRKEREYYEN